MMASSVELMRPWRKWLVAPTDQRITGYEQDGGSVAVRTAAGQVHRGDVLIGADGLRSAVRAQLLGDGEPRVSGHTTYRSVIPVERMPEELRKKAEMKMVRFRTLGCYPLTGAIESEAEGLRRAVRVDPEKLDSAVDELKRLRGERAERIAAPDALGQPRFIRATAILDSATASGMAQSAAIFSRLTLVTMDQYSRSFSFM